MTTPMFQSLQIKHLKPSDSQVMILRNNLFDCYMSALEERSKWWMAVRQQGSRQAAGLQSPETLSLQ